MRRIRSILTRGRRAVLTCTAMLSLSASAAWSADLYVSATGVDPPVSNGPGAPGPLFRTIQEAIDSANPLGGDVIHVAPGAYRLGSEIVVNKGITLAGANAGVCGHGARRGAETVVRGSRTALRVTTRQPVVIDGFKFRPARGQGVLDSYVGDENVTIKNCILINTRLFFDTPDQFTFDGNYFSNAGAALDGSEGIYIDGDWDGATGTTIAVTNNVWENTRSTGLNLRGVSGSVTGNRFKNVRYYGVCLAKTSGDVTISGNVFDGIVNPDPARVRTWGAGVRLHKPAFTGPIDISGNRFLNSHAGVANSYAGDANRGAGDGMTGQLVSVTGNEFAGNMDGNGPREVRDRGTADSGRLNETLVERVTELSLAASPNPSPGTTRIDYALPQEGRVRLSVLDVQGRELAVLAAGAFRPGRYQAIWTGQTDNGPAPAGLYFIRLQTPGKNLVRRLALSQ